MQFRGYAVAIVLIVEDEDQVRVLAESFLQGEGHTTLSAATVDQAVALLESEDPIDVLFADVTIQDGPEAGLALASKAVERRPELKVLYTSDQGVTDGMQALSECRRLKPDIVVTDIEMPDMNGIELAQRI